MCVKTRLLGPSKRSNKGIFHVISGVECGPVPSGFNELPDAAEMVWSASENRGGPVLPILDNNPDVAVLARLVDVISQDPRSASRQ